MKKRYIVVMCSGILIAKLVVLFCNIFSPVKYAIKAEELKYANSSYYMIKWTQVTGASWKIVGDENGYYDDEEYIIAKGSTPEITYDIATGDNVYICYGNFTGMTEETDFGDEMKVYEFWGWDILYPVKRNTPPFLPMPKEYICKFDLLGTLLY